MNAGACGTGDPRSSWVPDLVADLIEDLVPVDPHVRERENSLVISTWAKFGY